MPSDVPLMEAQPKQIIGGKYRLISLLGTGGMGAVWRAEHTVLRQQVAIKLLDARGPGAHRAVQRFMREGQIAAAVRHRNVVYISDFGTENGTPYLVMELLEGAPLADRVFTGETFRLKRFLRLMLGCLDGLAAVHAAGIIHRDIKPENIFLVQEGDSEFPKLLDFGLSRSTDPDETGQITRDGLILGTPEYISPEQARGSRTLDRRADLYSLGVLIYEALAGRIPFEAENHADLIAKVLREPFVPLIEHRPDVGMALNDFVARAMSRDREERFASAEDMRAALEDAMEQTPDLGRLCLPRQYNGATGTSHYTTAVSTIMSQPGERISSRSLADTALYDSDHPSSPSLPTALSAGSAVRRWMWPALAGSVALVGVVALLVLSFADDPAPPAVAEKAPEVADIPVVVPPPVVEQLPPPEPAPPTTLQVELRGVPEGAEVRVDGEPVAGAQFELPRGDEAHEIEVVQAGYRTWRMTHATDSDGTYDVRMVPRGRTTQAPRAKKRGPTLVRDLDF